MGIWDWLNNVFTVEDGEEITVLQKILSMENDIEAIQNLITSLPIATTLSLGVIKVGNGLAITEEGELSSDYEYELPEASTSVLGGVKLGSNVDILNGHIFVKPASSTIRGAVMPLDKTAQMTQDVGVDSNGKLYTIPGGSTYVLPEATYTTLGGVHYYNFYIATTFGGLSAEQVAYDSALYATYLDDTSPKVIYGVDTNGYICSAVGGDSGYLSFYRSTNRINLLFTGTTLTGITQVAFLTNIPTASATIKGGIKVGAGLQISDSVLSCAVTGAGIIGNVTVYPTSLTSLSFAFSGTNLPALITYWYVSFVGVLIRISATQYKIVTGMPGGALNVAQSTITGVINNGILTLSSTANDFVTGSNYYITYIAG